LGYNAGTNVTTASYDIYIGHAGYKAEGHTIRIGTQGTFQTQAFIAGISGTNVTGGTDVVVNGSGKLGVVLSSARFKRDIRDMGESSSGLTKLRPVTFRYKTDESGTLQYGLVAEEVARVYPELVTYGADGKVETVRYSELAAMLINELQKQSRELQRQTKANEQQAIENTLQAEQIRGQARVNARQAKRIRKLESERASFEQRLSALEQTMLAKNGGGKMAAAR
jgi:trimeric autotransporter adhesin